MTDKKELAVTEGNKLIASKEDRQLVETFMGYAEGYLSNIIKWNDVMPVVEKIKIRLNEEANYTLDYTIHFIFSIAGDKSANLEFHTITDLWEATVEYVKWHNKTFQTPTK